jgi:hypothetical protein
MLAGAARAPMAMAPPVSGVPPVGIAGTDSHDRMDLPSKPCTPEWLTRG